MLKRRVVDRSQPLEEGEKATVKKVHQSPKNRSSDATVMKSKRGSRRLPSTRHTTRIIGRNRTFELPITVSVCSEVERERIGRSTATEARIDDDASQHDGAAMKQTFSKIESREFPARWQVGEQEYENRTMYPC